MTGDPQLDAARRRARRTLVAGVALGSTGHIAAVTIGVIVARDLLGSSALAGLPSSTVVLGAAAGAITLSSYMARRGRRPGLVLGYLVSIVGALLAALAVVLRSFPLLLPATFLIGYGNASNQLSRYAAADMVPVSGRASAIGLVVWGATVGSVVGPTIVPFAGAVAEGVGLPALAGPYFLPVVFVGLAALMTHLRLRPDPMEIAEAHATRREGDPDAEPLRRILARPTVVAAIVALVIGQVTMVLIMTMTPLHMTDHGHGLAAVGLVLSAHTFGMFALAPVSGRLTDRLGTSPTIFLGTGVLIGASLLAALAPPDGGVVLGVALFLLGFGWNLGFVAGSALLASGLEVAERTRVQGLIDALIWSTGAVASLGSGVIVELAGYTTLGLLGAAIVVLPIWVVAANRGAIAGVRPPRVAAS